METHIVRAFLTLLLNREQRKELLRLEKGTRNLMGFEICRHFRLKPEPVTEIQEQTMTALFKQWWKTKKIENAEFSSVMDSDNMKAWTEYAVLFYQEPIEMMAHKGFEDAG